MFPNWMKWLDNNGLENWKYHLKYLDIPLGEDHDDMGHETVQIAYENDHLERVIFGVDEVGFKSPDGGGIIPAVIIGERL